jgi:catechol 2,3-dioxygenase-like lactoylglutathione lyase family enzyme
MSVPLTRREFVAALAVPPLAAAVGAGSGVAGSGVAAQSSPSPAFRVNGLSQITLTVSDVKRSLAFYQGLFGMPIQARQGSSVLLRIGNGPRFLALRPAAAGEKPSISALGFGVRDFNLDRAVTTLAGRGVSAAAAGAPRPGPKQALVRVRRADEGGSADGSTRELFVADPSGIVFQLHDVSYCGGSGAQGSICNAVEPSATRGLIALRDTSHFTIAASDPMTVPFYLDLFGFKPTAFQAQTPSWGVGDGVHFLMFIGGGGPTRADFGGAPAAAGAPRAGGPPAGGPPAGRAGGGPPAGRAGGGPGPARAAAIDHCCVAMDNFDPAAVTKILTDFGLTKQEGQARTPLVTYISLRMPNRGGAEGGTPELYLTDPDGLAVQLQDVKYCGGGGYLGEICAPLP